MSQPPDKIIFDLVPNDDEDDPAIILAIQAEINRLTLKYPGIKITQSGEVDPTAVENTERAEEIKAETAPKLFEYTRREKDVVLAEERRPDGKIHRRVERIGERSREFSISLEALSRLVMDAVDKFSEKADKVIEIATKVGTWIAGKVDKKGAKTLTTKVDEGSMNLTVELHGLKSKDSHGQDPTPPRDLIE